MSAVVVPNVSRFVVPTSSSDFVVPDDEDDDTDVDDDNDDDDDDDDVDACSFEMSFETKNENII